MSRSSLVNHPVYSYYNNGNECSVIFRESIMCILTHRKQYCFIQYSIDTTYLTLSTTQ